MISIISKILKGTEWSRYVDFMSPAFFDVVPAAGILKEAARLVKSSVGDSKAKTLETNARSMFSRIFPLDSSQPTPQIAALSLYFIQILHLKGSLVDLRATAFGGDSGADVSERLIWHPKPIMVEWDSDFLTSMRELYRGFYGGDTARFRRALDLLGLGPAETEIMAHFGTGDQSQVVFRLADFRESFHRVFLACKHHSLRIHPQFFGLGVALVCLYEHLETAEVPIDVRTVFQRVAGTLSIDG